MPASLYVDDGGDCPIMTSDISFIFVMVQSEEKVDVLRRDIKYYAANASLSS